MKKAMLLLSLLLAAMLLGGCGSGSEEHTHSPLEGWERNATAHWKVWPSSMSTRKTASFSTPAPRRWQ